MSGFFKKIFMIPAESVFGVDIFEQNVRFVELLPRGGSYVLGRFGKREIPVTVMENGQVKDEQGLKTILLSVRSKNNIKFATVSIPDKDTFFYRLKLAAEKLKNKENVKDEIRNEIKERNLAGNKENYLDAYLSYEGISGEGGMVELGISAIPNSLVERYSRIFTSVGYKPVSFEGRAQAIARAVVRDGDAGMRMVVDIGEESTTISIIAGRAVEYCSPVNFAGRVLKDEIKNKLNVSAEKAEKILAECGLAKEYEGKRLYPLLSDKLSYLKDEIDKRFVHWHREDGISGESGGKIEEIILCGPGANVPGLPEYLSSNLRLPVSAGNVWENINSFDEYIPEVPFGESLGYAAAIGLALKSVRKN